MADRTMPERRKVLKHGENLRRAFAEGIPDAQRCTYIRKNGVRCRQWRVKGTDRCICKRHQRRKRGYQYGVGVGRLPLFYARVMTQTLKERVEEHLARTQDEQIELYEELALMREGAAEAVRLFAVTQKALDAATEANESEDKIRKLRDHANTAAQLMSSQLDAVKEYVQAIARVRNLTKEKLTIHTMYGVIHQITRIVYEVCGEENEDIARMLELQLRTKIVLPTEEARGTALTPDADVSEMDGTVPRSEA